MTVDGTRSFGTLSAMLRLVPMRLCAYISALNTIFAFKDRPVMCFTRRRSV